jgi:hypothetical protein
VLINILVYGYILDLTHIMYQLTYSPYELHVQPTHCYLELKQQSMITVIAGMERKSYRYTDENHENWYSMKRNEFTVQIRYGNYSRFDSCT